MEGWYRIPRYGMRMTSAVTALAALALAGCSKPEPATSRAPAQTAAQFPPDSSSGPATSNGLKVPKVPFGNQPCQSLTAADQQTLHMSEGPGKPDRAPAGLPNDNVCSYGGASQIGYMTDLDYQFNHDGNRSTSHQAPADLSGAFYDQQGGLWFAKNGYYVVVRGSSALREPVARVIAGKL